MTKMGAPITLERSQYPDRSLHDRVVHAIWRKILGGELPPGALLPAEPELGASRTVLREAIKSSRPKGWWRRGRKSALACARAMRGTCWIPTCWPGSSGALAVRRCSEH